MPTRSRRLPEPVVLFGASVRALAFSVLRAGLQPVCHDLFADRDLARVATTHVIDRADYPHGFLAFMQEVAGHEWMYTGGLENNPELLEAMESSAPLLGNGGAIVRRVRDPWAIQGLLRQNGFHTPALSSTPDDLPTDGTWLQKPRRGAGGYGIQPWHEQVVENVDRWHWQQRIDGEPCSAAFLGNGTTARLMGATRQLIGEAFCGAPAFAYCGNVGPLDLPTTIAASLTRLGQLFAGRFSLRGWFGVDFILVGTEVWPLEINPRYVASLEVLERSLGFNAFELHRAACIASSSDSFATRDRLAATAHLDACHENATGRVVGKAILYADRPCTLADGAPCFTMEPSILEPAFADLPTEGTTFAPGEPILTLFEVGSGIDDCVDKLRRSAGSFRSKWLVEIGDPRGGIIE